ncbi:uncharacterized protein B0P05DRAFT_533675 [Gilbertella persicaria]|uniref:uncharacterized protein n=1 Tax=Gilbertella persicaria TaxID=101096 RepID=UPI002220349F|nr:uncharacterized protein B0P05DRAFT_533675 [Gilbertella persicaria]KAI8085780.1 hypothetical protein B0P05DRAFT_533675 [Gilbertella persicaria]
MKMVKMFFYVVFCIWNLKKMYWRLVLLYSYAIRWLSSCYSSTKFAVVFMSRSSPWHLIHCSTRFFQKDSTILFLRLVIVSFRSGL